MDAFSLISEEAVRAYRHNVSISYVVIVFISRTRQWRDSRRKHCLIFCEFCICFTPKSFRLNAFHVGLELIVENAFFAVRVVRVWNSLPDDVVSADSLPLFVGRLRSVDLGSFIVGRS